ncbi:hypothetical protein ACP6EK_06435 [Candidatus Caldatribacterium sp. SIUC1]|uniref:hypothetical protein n=1 Tax=Candidatus Caldatribacterium sp. SIUC1 TaxID=3418365 RepID=UPI003F6917D6
MGKVVKLHHARSVEALLELFLFEKKAEGRAPRTIRDYREHVFRSLPLLPQCPVLGEKEMAPVSPPMKGRARRRNGQAQWVADTAGFVSSRLSLFIPGLF